MNTMVTAGLKCAPDIACPKSVMIHIPSIIPDYWSPMSRKNTPRTAVPISSTMNLEIFTKKYCLALRLVLFKLSSYGESSDLMDSSSTSFMRGVDIFQFNDSFKNKLLEILIYF